MSCMYTCAMSDMLLCYVGKKPMFFNLHLKLDNTVAAINLNNISSKLLIYHLQLRNLVWSTSKHDVYLVAHYSIVHWSSLSSKRSEVLNVSGHVAPCEVIIFALFCC